MLANREAEDRERSEFIISAREPRAVLGNCKIGCPIFLSFFEYIACFFFLPMTSWSILCFQESLRSVNHEQLPCKWHRTPIKIHRERKRADNKKPRSRESIALYSEGNVINTATTACTEAATKYYNYTANETDEKREHRLPTLQKPMRRSGNAWSLQSKLSSSTQR